MICKVGTSTSNNRAKSEKGGIFLALREHPIFYKSLGKMLDVDITSSSEIWIYKYFIKAKIVRKLTGGLFHSSGLCLFVS